MIFEDWGLIDYEKALVKQIQAVEIVIHQPDHPGFLIFCTHPAVVTTGRQTQAEDIFAWTGRTVEVSRGGRATYHGPSQVVVYPIINLKKERHGRKSQEIRGYIRALETAIIDTLSSYDIKAFGKTQSATENNLQDTGVWVGEKKIASIGIAVRGWVSFHGAAINIENDIQAFQGLNPCGYQPSVMTNLELLTQKKINLEEFKEKLKTNCLEKL